MTATMVDEAEVCRRLRSFARPHSVLDKSEMRQGEQLAEILKHHLRHKAHRLIAAAGSRPIMYTF